MMYTKQMQTGKSKIKTKSVAVKTNKKLLQLQLNYNITHCELCSTTAITNAHRHKRVWYKNRSELLWDYNQVLFLCMTHHQWLDDRSQTSESEKEKIFIRLRGN